MIESEKFLDKILTYVDDSDKHWFKCHKADIKAYAKIYHKEQLTLTDVVQQSEHLPEFLIEDLDGKIITSVIGSSDVTKEWNEYLGNCD